MAETRSCEAIAEYGIIERYLAGRLSEVEVETFESHYLTCSRCRDELRLGMAIRAVLPEVQQATEHSDARTAARTQHWFRRPATVGAAAAIAAVLIGVLVIQPARRVSVPHREAAPETASLPRAEVPTGDVRGVEEFRWAPMLAADLYRIILYDGSGEVVWQTDTRETSIAPAESLSLEPGVLYLWQVDARVDWDRWVSSELVRFRISRP